MKPLVSTVTIANGASLSGSVSTGNAQPIGVAMPGTWTTAGLTFQASVDGGATWLNVYESDGTEYTVTADASQYVILPPADWAGITNIKVRSGTSGSAVSQGGDRIITIAMRSY